MTYFDLLIKQRDNYSVIKITLTHELSANIQTSAVIKSMSE